MQQSGKISLMLVLATGSGTALADDEWRLRLTPYLWFAGLEGDVGTIPGLPPADVDVSHAWAAGQ
jgi:hypothetical protein